MPFHLTEREVFFMEKITSFTIDHIKLQPGVYVSRKDPAGDSVITTFDIRMTSPNEEPVMNTAELHTIEHLAATFLRNHKDFGSKKIASSHSGLYFLSSIFTSPLISVSSVASFSFNARTS